MKKDLRFIKGAISTKDFVPVLKHVHIRDGQAQAFNGSIALSTPIDIKETVTPVAADFIKAIELCKDTPQLSVTKAGRLKIQDGSFKAFVKVINDESFPTVTPTGTMLEDVGDIARAFRCLLPFVGTDASRAWSSGIIIKNNYAYATNNVVLACYTRPLKLPNELIIPLAAIREVIRIAEPVERVQMDSSSVTFHFSHGRWLRSNLIDHKAPDFGVVLSKCSYKTETMQAVSKELPEILERLKPFTDKKIPQLILRKSGIYTDYEKDEGACDTSLSFHLAVFRYEPLYEVSQIATHWNLEYYPSPCPFVSEDISGVIIGQRLDHVSE